MSWLPQQFERVVILVNMAVFGSAKTVAGRLASDDIGYLVFMHKFRAGALLAPPGETSDFRPVAQYLAGAAHVMCRLWWPVIKWRRTRWGLRLLAEEIS